MKIQIKFFASIREKLAVSSETLELDAASYTAGAVRELLIARGGAWAEVLGVGRAVRMAYNQQMVDASATLADGGELAFFPPVTGG
jgi:molybdopterin synthase sulfur carrier subunit